MQKFTLTFCVFPSILYNNKAIYIKVAKLTVTGKKIYLQPMETVLNTIHDTVELLRGRPTVSDTPNGKVKTRLTMYGYKWDVIYTVADIGRNRCSVAVEIEGERQDKKREIRSVFALLDSMLLVGAEIDYEGGGEGAGCGQ